MIFTVSAIGAGLSDYALKQVGAFVSRAIDSATRPAERFVTYFHNDQTPNILPSPDAIIEATRRGYLADNIAQYMLNQQGIAWDVSLGNHSSMSDALYASYANTWEQVGKLKRSRPSPDGIAQLFVAGRIKPSEMVDVTAGYDVDWNAYFDLLRRGYQTPGFDQLLQLRRLGKITQSAYDQATRALGWHDMQWRQANEMVTPVPNLYALLRLKHIGKITDADYDRLARAGGYSDEVLTILAEQGYNQIPSGPELVNLAVRDAWNEDVVQRWGYDSEFPAPMEYWMRAQGWDWSTGFTGSDGKQYPPTNWPKLFWRAHWQTISPGQAYQAYRRLRPERIERYQQEFPGIQPFTAADLNTLLKVHDYPPAARNWLAAISSQPLRMFTIRTAYQSQVRDRAWATEQLYDIGYRQDDAAAILDTIDAKLEEKAFAATKKLEDKTNAEAYKQILAGYEVGVFERQEAIDAAVALGFTSILVTRALAVIDQKVLLRDVRTGIAAIKRDYDTGAYSDVEVIARLRSYRVSATAAARYLARWQSLRLLSTRTATTQQILHWVRDGLMTADVASIRLANLGWANADALLLVQDTLAHLAHAEAQSVEASARRGVQSAKQIQAQIRASQAAIRQAQDQLRRLTPLATVHKWLVSGIVSQSWARARLEGMGYDAADIERYIAEWAIEQQQAAAKAQGGSAAKAKPASASAAQPVTGAGPASP